MKSQVTVPEIIKHRVRNRDAAIVFIHGFTGSNTETWGSFPGLLVQNLALDEWDVVSLGYATRFAPDLSGVWSADAPIDRLATLLRTTVNFGIPTYKTLAILAHSMGGLVLQRALVDDSSFAEKVGHVFLFGTPSNGLAKASPIGFFKRQLRDMKQDGIFITDLRSKWEKAFSAGLPFTFWTVAGERDEFVTSSSSLDVFPAKSRAVIPGNHLEIVKPQNQDHLGLQLVTKTIIKDAAPAGPWNSAKVAVEARDFRKAIQLLEPHASELDEAGLVELALAYDSFGRTSDSITLLEDHGRDRTDAMGTLAGRLKRRWMLERRMEDYDRALKLYSHALRFALNEAKPDQVYYHAINVAFLRLAAGDRTKALETAQQALEYAQHGDLLQWRLATRGEAFLMLGNVAAAIESYTQALAATPVVREIESMYKQAMWIAELQKNLAAVRALNDVFRHQIQTATATAG
jgi:pimeloyl-ACP methyl ester carboxylesterase